MKLPTGDNDLREDEIEGLVTSCKSTERIGNSGFQTRSSQWGASSRSVGKSKKALYFIAIVALVSGFISFSKNDSNVTAGSKFPDVINPDYDYGTKNSSVEPDDDVDDDDRPVDNSVNDSSQSETAGTIDAKEEDDDDHDEGESEDAEEEVEESDSVGAVEEDVDVDDESETPDEEEVDTEEDADADADAVEEHEAWPVDETEKVKKEAEKLELIEQWGKWHFWDGDPDSRPKEDFLAKYPNRDCPFDDFPETSWQGDAVYVNHMLDSAAELVIRAKEAIYTEYGYGPKDSLDRDQLKTRMAMFRLHLIDLAAEDVVDPKSTLEGAGWSTSKSLTGLARRLIHAMMTNDTFTIVLGGHSAAAGHGNHFQQSYMMQMYKVLNPIFERVGVKLIIRNLAQGGLGTLQHTLGSSSIYGDNIDVLVWDSSMTEKQQKLIDLFYRQALIGGKRAPVLWGGPFNLLKDLYLHADADVMVPGTSMSGIPETVDDEQASELPFAARYMKCASGSSELCGDAGNRFRTRCWIDRDDVTPPTPQNAHVGSQVKWHPGFRFHQLTSRSMSMVILTAMQDAIDTWSEITIIEGHPLAEENWHITDHYNNIRTKAMNLDPSVGACSQVSDAFPERICRVPMKGRTEFTPRANPDETSLRTIIKPAPDGWVPKIEEEMLYDGPDVPNPSLMVPEGELDVEAIVVNRRRQSEFDMYEFMHPPNQLTPEIANERFNLRRRRLEEIKAGKGWLLDTKPGNCDGTATGICGREKSSNCLLSGHMDYRGGLIGDEFSGWFAVNVPNVTAGIIIIKVETWHLKRESKLTEGWTAANNDEYTRSLKETAPPLPDNFMLDYAIDGQVTSLDLEQYNALMKNPQRVVQTLTVLDDPDMKESKDVEVAFRLRNCGRDCVWKVTHVYWS